MDEKLSIRKAETVAAFLRRTRGSRIAASVLRYKTPIEVAEIFLGSKASKVAITNLAKEICKEINVPVET